MTRDPQHCCVYIAGIFCVPTLLSNEITDSADPTHDLWYNSQKWGHIIIKARLIYPRSAELFTPSMSLEFRKVTKSLGMGLKVVYDDVPSRKKASDRTTPWWVAVIVRKFVRTLRKPQLNYVKVARMAPSQLTDKPVSWQDSRSWSSQVQDHGSQGSMSVFNRSVRISVCNFVKLCFFSFHQCVRNCRGQQASGRMKRRARNLRLQTDIPRGTSYSTPGFHTRDSTCTLLIENYVVKLHNAKKIWTITMVETITFLQSVDSCSLARAGTLETLSLGRARPNVNPVSKGSVLGPVSISDKTSYRKISWNLEAARLIV